MNDATTDTQLDIEFVFGDQRPFAQCHAATIVELPRRRVLCAFFAGTRESHDDVAIWGATRNANGSWEAPRRLAKVRDEPHWNPVLFSVGSGEGAEPELVLHFKVGRSIRRWETWFQRSTDGGETWTPPHPLVPGDRGGRGAVRNKPLLLTSGDWLAGASIERWRRWNAFFDRSPNGIDGWSATSLVARGRPGTKGKGLIQPTLWESEPGTVHALFRSTDGFAHRSDSHDDGRSWSRTRATRVPNNNSGLDVARLPDGTLALACNPVSGNWAARTPLSVLFSYDNGETWPTRIDLETEPGEFSYPAIIPRDDGLAVAYSWNRRRIAYVEISAEAIPRRV